MKNMRSFDRVMKNIEGEFETQRLEEIRLAERRKLMGHIRKVAGCVALLGVLGGVYYCREGIKGAIFAKFGNAPQQEAGALETSQTPQAASKQSIKAAQDNATVRDALIEGETK